MAKDDDGGLCCCCIGLAIGYLIFAPGAKGECTAHENTAKQATIEQRVEAAEENFLLRQIGNYQQNISPKIKEALGKEKLCRYEPSCSEYAKQAIKKHGKVKGTAMAAKRLAKCNPLSKGGYDPVA